MKRSTLILIVSFVILGLLFVGCKTKEKETLRVGIGGEYPPFSYFSNNQMVGIDVDISRRIAEKLGMELNVVHQNFDAMFPSLASNKLDMVVDAISITEERKLNLDFSAPYYTTDQVVIARHDSPIKIQTEADLGKYTIGSLNETTGSQYIRENLVDKDLLPRGNLLLYATTVEAMGELLNGKLDLVVIDETAAKGYAKQKPLKTVYTIDTNESYAIALQKGRPLNEKIILAMEEMLKSGEVQAIINNYIN